MTLTEILTITATALSPVIAVQVTRYLDDRNEVRGRKLQVFKTLMATRALNLSPAHVEVLNRIDLEFSPKVRSEKVVLDVWQQYLDHLGQAEMESGAWNMLTLMMGVVMPATGQGSLPVCVRKTVSRTCRR